MRLMRRSLNTDGQRHADKCVALAAPSVALRYPDGTPTGFELTEAIELKDGSCPPGHARIDFHEVIDSAVGPLVFHRGGRGYADAPNVKYGHIALSGLATHPGWPAASGGHRGAPAPLAEEVRVVVRSIPAAMHYKRPQDVRSGSNRGARFLHYGDPAADQGDRSDVHYTYLLWSFLNARGGGMVRALVPDGALLTRCDVPPITMTSWDDEGRPNGRVEAIYVRTPESLFGWIVSGHGLGDAPWVDHVTARPGMAQAS